MPAATLTRWLRASSLTVYRLVTWTLLAAAFVFGAVILTLRYGLLPNIDQHREGIARVIGEAVGQRVEIGKVSGNWDGLHPELLFEDVTLFDAKGSPALKFSRIESTLSWITLAAWEPRFRSVEIRQPVLDIRRDASGAIYVAGIEMKGGEGGGFVAWLLRQRRLSVRQAEISWHDEFRGASPLRLTHVDFLLRNRGSRHRFGVRAVPPRELAGPLDLRGEAYGRATSASGNWQGRLFVQVDTVDLDAWRPWLPAALPTPTGAGALRMWLGFREQRVVEATADVRLAGVRVRLAPDVPELELAALSGRVGWKDVAGGMEVSTTELAFSTGEGLKVEPTDFFLRVSGGTEGAAARGELRASALALEPLAMLADRLPIDSELRSLFAALSPRGHVLDLAARWNGDWRAPSHYVARARFQDLAMTGIDKIPGFSGVTGAFEGTEKSGTIRLDSSGVTLDMPHVFRGPLQLDTLVAEIGWSHAGAAPQLQFEKVAFSNAHFAGSVSGSYRAVPEGRGVIDIAGNLTRADARYVAHYIPLVIGQPTRDWLDTSLLSGRSTDVTLRLKGDLDAFPFPEDKGGVFEVVAKVNDGVLDYATGWPRIENIAGDVTFRGKRMEVNARRGTMLGARLLKVRAEIPDVVHDYEVLHIAGEAEGPSAEFLSFIEKSPVLDMIDRFSEGMRMQGAGKLALKLEMPLRERQKSRITGNYEFAGNRLAPSPDAPALEQASGRLEFTESSVRLPHATATFLGGPVVLSTTTQQSDGAVSLDIQGRTDFANIREVAGVPGWTKYVTGAAEWRGSLTLRKKPADMVIESDLRGIASELPPPFSKTADEQVPLRIERRFIGQAGGVTDRIEASYGGIVSARLVRRHGETRDTILQGAIHFGGQAPEPERDGVWIGGKLKRVDLDRWLALASGETALVGAQADIGGIDMSLEELQVFNRVFHDVALNGTARDGGWRARLSGRELDGTVTWQPQDRGKLTARMSRLSVPAAVPGEPREEKHGRELPALDIIAEQFQFKDKALGKLELSAVPVERDWRIDRLHISNPDAVFTAQGLVRDMVAQPRSRATVSLETGDIGKLLARLGYPEGVRRGTARLEGTLAWPGAPQDFDYGGLTGNLKLNAAKGQFVKLEPGIGKLFGILSLQALPRRVTLDFRDIFSEGFAFDEIAGDVGIERGIASTDNFRIQGPAARIAMSGEVDLARETQKLHVRIVPSLSDSVSIAGALIGGPVAGVATILAQKILKDPLDQIFAYEYSVTGTWTEPQVSKIDRPAPAATEVD